MKGKMLAAHMTDLKAKGAFSNPGPKRKRKKKGKLGPEKAKLMLKEGTARGKALTGKQKRLFGFVAGGGKPTRVKG